jgi:amidohydrolase
MTRSLALHGLLPLLLTAAVAAEAQTFDTRIAQGVERFSPMTIDLRHTIHQNPELGNREFETAKLIAAHLQELGIEVQTGVGKTGVVGILRGGKPGPVVALRADIDALPVTEDTPFPFKSTKRGTYLGQEVGISHACGHDIHTAVQLGVASMLASMKADLPGTVMFIFQPAEEGPPPGEEGGAALMVKEGVFEKMKPAAVFGLHVWADEEVGKVATKAGPMLAAAEGFDATVTGRQAHGAMPHIAVDPIVMASEIVMALQTVRSRNMDPFQPGVITVGLMRGGERRNIIPTTVELQGTVRTFDTKVQTQVEDRIRAIFDGITKAHGGSFTLTFDRAYPLTSNDSALYERMKPSMQRVLGDKLVTAQPTTGGEDFSFFANEVPGLFLFLGGRKVGGTTGGHHTPTFQVDDASIPVGMKVMTTLVMDFLSGRGAVGN